MRTAGRSQMSPGSASAAALWQALQHSCCPSATLVLPHSCLECAHPIGRRPSRRWAQHGANLADSLVEPLRIHRDSPAPVGDSSTRRPSGRGPRWGPRCDLLRLIGYKPGRGRRQPTFPGLFPDNGSVNSIAGCTGSDVARIIHRFDLMVVCRISDPTEQLGSMPDSSVRRQ